MAPSARRKPTPVSRPSCSCSVNLCVSCTRNSGGGGGVEMLGASQSRPMGVAGIGATQIRSSERDGPGTFFCRSHKRNVTTLRRYMVQDNIVVKVSLLIYDHDPCMSRLLLTGFSSPATFQTLTAASSATVMTRPLSATRSRPVIQRACAVASARTCPDWRLKRRRWPEPYAATMYCAVSPRPVQAELQKHITHHTDCETKAH